MNPNEPLGLPRGSVRALLALLIVGSVIVFNGIGMVTGAAVDATTVGLAGAVVGWYFAKRDAEDDAPAALAEPFLAEPD